MSESTLVGTRSGQGSNNTNATLGGDVPGLSETLQGHVDDIRALLQCGICIRPLYEPFTLACGHSFCYSCLTSWFAGGRSNKTCPDCRAPVKTPPAPAYLIRAVVQLFTSRAELLEKGETTAEHTRHQREEAEKLENDKKNTHPKVGGLFRGAFNKKLPVAQPIVDLEDNVIRCPRCSWELEDSNCAQCGYRRDEWAITGTSDVSDASDASDSTDSRSTVSILTDSEENSEMTDYLDDELEDGFGELDDFNWNGFQNGVPIQGRVEVIPRHLYNIIRDYHQHHPPHRHVFAHNGHIDDTSSTAHDTEETDDYSEDTDMDSFIDDDEHIDQDHDSDSDRSTVVGGPETRYLPDQYQVQLSSEMTMPLADDCTDDDLSSLDEIPDSEEDDEDDEDEDDEPIRPPVSGNRRRVFPASNGASNSPVLSSRAPRAPNVDPYAMRRQASRSQTTNTAGTSASNAITLDDDSDEGPVRPFRRNCRHGAR
ncbi:RING finger domain protein [Aspergillus nomiae NRRL 13137]|uniref:RING finger domain protein n=1 Tax=Aspergillus nomiae NRRL (strain ATCC 15546 / NRRL 13137 / CBS 260.88 / M93) TaxID=1509407 RepID=A0A0L1IY59_ASPN3|nr:RING finger domain protein [Aspergillus nomiae NRRL 13137]KNG84118.1 RING finger domain protein [Aspergillus nomiae NRRL 13137]